MEKGIAIPHAIYANVKTLKIAIYRPLNPIDFAALDARPTSLILAVVAPLPRRQQYLNVLASLSRILRNSRFRVMLEQAQSPKEVVRILKKADVLLKLNREFQEAEG